MRIIYMLPLVAVATCLTAFSQDSSQVPSSDQAFLKEAAAGNLAEIQTGRLAEKKASSPVVKQFGQRMVTDHTKLLDQTKGLASRLNVMLPTSVDSKDQTKYKELSAKSGSDFDKAYIEAMLKDHNHDISAFEQEANSGMNADVKALAQRALPTLQEHLKLAENAAKQLGIATSTGGMR